MDLDVAASHFTTLCHKYGPRRDITEFPTGLVLAEIAMATDRSRLQDLTNRYYQQIMRGKTV